MKRKAKRRHTDNRKKVKNYNIVFIIAYIFKNHNK